MANPLIQSIGFFWRRDKVLWGRGRQAGALWGVAADSVTDEPTNFRDQVGVYVLYADYDLLYVGQTGSGSQKLLKRLNKHRSDDLAARWDRFSWFGLRRVLESNKLSNVNQHFKPDLKTALHHIEAVLIHAAEPRLNRQAGSFGEHVTRYSQLRDERLGPTRDEMITAMWKKAP